MFTASPGRRSPKVVTAAVWGMMFTPKFAPSTSFTVSDTPSMAMLPFGAINRASGSGRRGRDSL